MNELCMRNEAEMRLKRRIDRACRALQGSKEPSQKFENKFEITIEEELYGQVAERVVARARTKDMRPRSGVAQAAVHGCRYQAPNKSSTTPSTTNSRRNSMVAPRSRSTRLNSDRASG